MVKIYLARHAQTNYNVEKRLNSDPSVDVRLTELGIEQAQALAKKLSGEKFDAIYISELPRTKQTASFVNKHHDLPLIVDKRLNDHKSGFESRPTHEFMAAFDADNDRWHTRFKGGESLAEARKRAADFLNDLKTKPYTSVLIVTHGYIVESIYGILHNLGYEEASAYQLPQGEFAIFDVD